MANAQSQMAAGWIDDLLHGRSALPYRDLINWDKSEVLHDSLIERAKDMVDKEAARIFGSPQFDASVADEETRKALVNALLNAYTFTIGDLQEVVHQSFSEAVTTWSDDPLDLRSLEADAITLAHQVFDRASGLGFNGDVLETSVLATVLNMSEVKILADVVKLEETLGTVEMSIDELALVLARFQALRNDYVVTRKMIVGGSISELSAEVVEPQLAAAFAPHPLAPDLDDNPFGDLGPGSMSAPSIAPPPVRREAAPPPSRVTIPQPPQPAMVPPTRPEPIAKSAENVELRPAPPTTPTSPVIGAAAKSGDMFDTKATWKDTFIDTGNRKALMDALRTRNDGEYDNWVNKVSQQASWKTARIHIDNYLYIFGVDRSAPLWAKIMKTSQQFFPDA